jgi:AAA domain
MNNAFPPIIAEPSPIAPPGPNHGMPELVIRTAEIAPVHYVAGIPFYPAGGTTFIWGTPGIGKSFVQQGLNHTIAWGKMTAGFIPAAVGNVLYCDFEGNSALTQERSLLLTPAGRVPGESDGQLPDTDTYYVYSHEWAGRSFAEHMAELDERLARKEADGLGFSMVIIDTFSAFIGPTPSGANSSDHDRFCIDQINNLAEKYQVNITMIHHPNKSGEMSGSVQRAGAAWVVMSFTSPREGEGVLKTEKNRVGWDMEYAFTWDKNRIWRLSDEIVPKIALAKGNNRRILHCLSGFRMTLAELREQLPEMPEGSLRSALFRLSRKGDVRFVDDRWETTFPSTQSLPLVPAWEPWPNCPACRTKVHPEYGCQNVGCGQYQAQNWPGEQPADGLPQPSCEAVSPPPAEGPDTAGSGATGALVRILSGSRLYPVFKLNPEIKELIPWEQMCLGGKGNQWALRPAKPTGRLVKSFDRKASYFSSNPWLVPNILTRRGPMEWEEIKADKLAGVFEIVATGWPHRHLPSPYGRDVPRKGTRIKVTRPTLNRLYQLSNKNLIEFPQILWGLVGKGSEELLKEWFDWCLVQRRTAADPVQAAARKAEQNAAIGSMRIVDPDKGSGYIDRWDWQYGIISHHYAQMDRYAYTALESGEPLCALGNTDEMVFYVPEDEDPETWVPGSMREHLAKRRFAVKYIHTDHILFPETADGRR